MVRRKNKKKRQVKRQGITINININQPTQRRRRRASAPQKKIGMNFKTGLDPNFRTFDPYIRSKVMEMEQNNNALQGNYLLKLKAIEDGRQQDVNNLNQLQTRYNQLQNNFLSLSYDYTLQEERQRERDDDVRTEYDFDDAMGDGVDNSNKFVNKPELTGATNSVINPSDNNIIDPEREAESIKVAFNKEVDSQGVISKPTFTRSFSQEGEAVEVEKIEVPEPLSTTSQESMGKEQEKKKKTIIKKKIKNTDKGIDEKEVKIVPPLTENKRGVKKGTTRGRYYSFPQREKYSREVFDRMASGELSENEAYNLDESVEYRKQRRAIIYGDKKGGGK